MRVLLIHNIGRAGRDFHGPNYGDAFEELGHSVTRVDYDQPLPNGEFDFMLHFYHSIDEATVNTLKDRGVVTVLLIGDEPCEFFRTKYFTPWYDLVFNQTGGWGNIEDHRALGANMYPLPHCANPSIYYPVDVTDRDRAIYGSDVAFIGSLRTPAVRGDRVCMTSSGFPLHSFDFKMWGPGTENDRWIYPEEVRKIYASSKIIFNPSAVSDQPDWDLQYPTLLGETACRVYNTAAAGAFQLAPRRYNTITQPFGEDEVGFYRHNDMYDLAHKVEDYLTYPGWEERSLEMAAKARRTCLAEHTYVHRAKVVIRKVEEYADVGG